MLVETRGEESNPIAPIGIGATDALIDDGWLGPAAGSSSWAYEFHALHSGQRPSHLDAWAPHSMHEKTIAFLATKRF